MDQTRPGDSVTLQGKVFLSQYDSVSASVTRAVRPDEGLTEGYAKAYAEAEWLLARHLFMLATEAGGWTGAGTVQALMAFLTENPEPPEDGGLCSPATKTARAAGRAGAERERLAALTPVIDPVDDDWGDE